jgi:hypothetical protein
MTIIDIKIDNIMPDNTGGINVSIHLLGDISVLSVADRKKLADEFREKLLSA